ncbi:MAG: radical SAM family heme chaperone HemW [Nitrospirota bacterium]
MADFLYIHIPFCIKKCLYCDFLSVPYSDRLVEKYIDALCAELRLKKEHAGALQAVYIGGGTPSLLPQESLQKVFRCIRDNFSFSQGVEITIEANPATLDSAKIGAAASLGVNRLSVGVQSFRDDELKTLGRVHSAADARSSLELIRQSNIENFSIDLMYGIPGQDLSSWRESLVAAVRFHPAHVSAYELTPEEKTPFYSLLKSGELEMPVEELILEMYGSAIDYFEEHGYLQYEISNFARSGFSCRHNLNYWNRGEYLAVGAGAHSFLHGVRSRNTDNISDYIDSLCSGIIPESESLRLTPEESLKETIFLGLRKMEGMRIDQLPEAPDVCRELIEEGFLEIEERRLKLTRKGLPVSNAVIVKLFQKLGL